MSLACRVRFAPSPTGYLHLGNARTALYNWLFARRQQGKFILRIEDTDVERSKPEYTEAILQDLKWLGLDWDEGPDCGGPHAPYLQSQRTSIYRAEVEKMEKSGVAYPCYCTPDELEQRRRQALAEGKPPKYDNRCRNLSARDKEKFDKLRQPYVWRFRVPEKRQITFKDLVRGDVMFDSETIGDFVIIKADGGPTFHLSVVIDDALMEVTHVVRGEDHLSNTPKHILLFEAMKAKIPQFAHLPMILGADHTPLSKRHGDTSVRQYWEHGFPPEALVNYLALLGWAAENNEEIFTPTELIQKFQLDHVNKAAAIFDPTKLGWVCAQHMKKKTDKEIVQGALPFLKAKGMVGDKISDLEEQQLEKAVAAARSGLKLFSEVPDKIALFKEDQDQVKVEDPEALSILKKPNVSVLLEKQAARIRTLSSLTIPEVQTSFKELQKELGVKGKDFFLPIRIALTGQLHGPELIDIIPALGKDRILKRLEWTLAHYCKQ